MRLPWGGCVIYDNFFIFVSEATIEYWYLLWKSLHTFYSVYASPKGKLKQLSLDACMAHGEPKKTPPTF